VHCGELPFLNSPFPATLLREVGFFDFQCVNMLGHQRVSGRNPCEERRGADPQHGGCC
jgi:hypothetical protein